MGGIWKKMPITFGAWIVSTAALCGVPFFSGFFSKDEIIDSAKHADYTWFYIVGIVGAFMTTAYMTRATYLTFFGRPRGGAAHFMGVADHSTSGHDDHADVHDAHADDHGHDDHGHDDHHAPAHHGWVFPFAKSDSPWQITAPLVILGALALGSGYLNAPALGIHWFEHQTESSIGLPIAGHGEAVGDDADHGDEDADAVTELALGAPGSTLVQAEAAEEGHAEAAGPFAVPAPPEFSWGAAAPGLVLVLLGFLISLGLSLAVFAGNKNPFSAFVGLTTRSRPIGAIHRFLVNKLYLDDLYEKVIVHGVGHPISKAAYWINQHVIDGVINAIGRGTAIAARETYDVIDQKVVDGAVNGLAETTGETGGLLRYVQSGRVQRYALTLFAAVGALSLALWLVY
jgi:NADH-quinone oxidoreductase subunit L